MAQESYDDLTEKILGYWAERASSFSHLRARELHSKRHELWLAELTRYIPEAPAKVLDIGCGSGFFTFLLAQVGYDVTGIDLTREMIDEARHQAIGEAEKISQAGGSAHFEVMNGEAPAFPYHSFDAIVSRNLTWTLPHLEMVYQRWFHLLRPGGVLVNIDGDYTHETRRLPSLGAHADISAALVDAYEEIKDDIAAVHKIRPAWDAQLLEAAGFSDITVDETAWQRLYPERDEFFNPTPVFTLVGRA